MILQNSKKILNFVDLFRNNLFREFHEMSYIFTKMSKKVSNYLKTIKEYAFHEASKLIFNYEDPQHSKIIF